MIAFRTGEGTMLRDDCDVAVISLATSLERREAFAAVAKDSLLAWGFFDALTALPAGLHYDPARALTQHGFQLLDAELGCYASHFALWKIAAARNKPMVILEDDVEVDWEFLQKLFTAPAVSVPGYLRLASRKRPPFIHRGEICGRELIEHLGHPWGSQGYMLSPFAASVLVRHPRNVVRPVDDELDRSWAHGIPNLAVSPPPVREIRGASTIGVRSVHAYGGSILAPKRLFARANERSKKELYFWRRRRLVDYSNNLSGND